jgi:diguanylate cyclase (GGDEF)-like protein/PAS domain S-box-containing protein
MLRTLIRNYLPSLLVFALVAGLYAVGALNFLQRELTDLNYRLVERTASDQLVLVTIDSPSLHELDRWPWPRSYHAQLVDNLVEAGAHQIAFDVDFSSASTPEEDAAFERALADAQGRVILTALKQAVQTPDGPGVALSAPLLPLQRHARVGTINVFAESDGLVRRAMTRDHWREQTIPSLIGLLSGKADAPFNTFYIDFGIDLKSIARLSYADVLAGRFDPAAVAGKDILIGSTAIELGDVMPAPVLKNLPGPVLLAVAYDSLVQDRTLRQLGMVPVLAFALVLALLIGPRLSAWSWGRSIGVLLAGSVIAAFGCVAIYWRWPLLIDNAPIVTLLAFLFAMGLVSRSKELSLRLLFQGITLRRTNAMMRGVVENSMDGILTASSEGEILTVNDAALRIFRAETSDLVGRDLTRLFPRLDDADSTIAEFFKVGEGPRELQGRRLDGSSLPIDTAMSQATVDDDDIYIALLRDITDRKAHQDELQHMALYDSLTDLPNRTLLRDRLDHALHICEREKSQLGLLLLDLDGFKAINDTLGHHMGDELLRGVAQRLAGLLRKSDTIARLGGDEFAILLPKVSGRDWAECIADRCLAVLVEPFEINDLSLEVGASVGIALYPDHAQEASRLMQCADVAMYLAKQKPENIAHYDAEQDHHTVRHLTMKGDLRHAIDENVLDLHFQPKIDIASGMIVGAEALLRWEHPTYGFQNPEEFVALAEKTGLIRPLTAWVLERGFAQQAAWRDEGFDFNLAVNLSTRNLHDQDLPGLIDGLLDKWELDRARITLEITEGAIMLDPDRALETVKALDALNVRLSIDDFGTGYSSLSYLKRLPVDELKIDKSFVIHMIEDESDAVIVRATIDLAHNLGLQVVAEGIEEQAHLDYLQGEMCDTGQGYFISRPMPAAAFPDWLDESPWPARRLDAARPEEERSAAPLIASAKATA